jgi:HSP20 family protein
MAITPFTRGSLRDFVSLRDVMDRLFEQSVLPQDNGNATPFAVDLKEQPDKYELQAELPGIRPEDVQIEVTAGTISISGEFKQEDEKQDGEYIRREIRQGRFHRMFSLPVEIDPTKVDASFRDGVLRVTLPKGEAMRPRQIRVQDRGAQSTQTGQAGQSGQSSQSSQTGERTGNGKDKSAQPGEVKAERPNEQPAGSTQRSG